MSPAHYNSRKRALPTMTFHLSALFYTEPAAEEVIFVLSFMGIVLMAPVGSKYAMKSSTNLLQATNCSKIIHVTKGKASKIHVPGK